MQTGTPAGNYLHGKIGPYYGGIWKNEVRDLILGCPAEVDVDKVAGLMVTLRPDLVDEVQDVLAELRGVAE